MGFAKYHEDNLHIIEERMYYKNAPDTLSVVRSTYKSKQPQYTITCPFCRCGVNTSKALVEHIFSTHGRRYEFIYLNNSKVNEMQCNVATIYSLKMYCFYDESKHIVISDDFDRKYYVDTVKGKYEYDITNALKGKMFSYLRIEIPGQEYPYEIQQYLDMNGASIDNILQNRYVSSLFDVRIANDKVNVDECIIYIKMLIHEGEDTEPFIQKINNIHFDYSRELTELYWYYCLEKETFDNSIVDEKVGRHNLYVILNYILLGNLDDAGRMLGKESRSDNDAVGLRLLHALLTHDEMAAAYNSKKYDSFGLIGMLVNVLYSIKNYEVEIRDDISLDIKELSLFKKYPLIKALINYCNSETNQEDLQKESYDLLKNVGGIISILYSRAIKDDTTIERILRSNVKLHPTSRLLKNIALDKDFSWINRRISTNDGEVYRRKLKEEISKSKLGFSDYYLDTFPYNGDISITALGGEKGIGASCFIISYKGFNIMIDAGLNPKKRDDEAYPKLDEWDGRIDLILLSHAHIDHSGGIPKAHAMWQDARIFMTKPSKVLLRFIYSDMAKVKNGITEDFEIENVNITRDVMEDTFKAISTVDFEDRIKVSEEIEICFHKAGHIVGAAMIELKIAGKIILYTGDYTDYDQNFVQGLNYDDLPRKVDYLITEATYIEKKEFDRYEQAECIKDEIRKNISSGKSILLPGASIGRSQELVSILGEMLESGDIPENYTLHIAGMAIPTTTQLIPFYNKEYEELLSQFYEFDGMNYPEEKTIVVASSGTMKKGSASYKIEKMWENCGIRYATILGDFADEDTEYNYNDWNRNERCRMPLSTHVSRNGIKQLLDYTEPKVVSVVHNGSDSDRIINEFKDECIKSFNNDLYFMDLDSKVRKKIFNLLEQVMEE